MQQIELENDYREAYFRTKCLKGIFTHDISNLFQIISNSIELCGSLIRDKMNIEDILEYFELIGKQLNRGKKLINNVRNLSDLEEYQMPLEPVEIYDKINQAIQFVYISFPGKIIDLRINPSIGTQYVLANELLVDIFENLLINSITSNKHERIQISITIANIDIS